jgi:hypothetical protein
MLAIRVLDHVILGADRYYSFSDKGLLCVNIGNALPDAVTRTFAIVLYVSF